MWWKDQTWRLTKTKMMVATVASRYFLTIRRRCLDSFSNVTSYVRFNSRAECATKLKTIKMRTSVRKSINLFAMIVNRCDILCSTFDLLQKVQIMFCRPNKLCSMTHQLFHWNAVWISCIQTRNTLVKRRSSDYQYQIWNRFGQQHDCAPLIQASIAFASTRTISPFEPFLFPCLSIQFRIISFIFTIWYFVYCECKHLNEDHLSECHTRAWIVKRKVKKECKTNDASIEIDSCKKKCGRSVDIGDEKCIIMLVVFFECIPKHDQKCASIRDEKLLFVISHSQLNAYLFVSAHSFCCRLLLFLICVHRVDSIHSSSMFMLDIYY